MTGNVVVVRLRLVVRRALRAAAWDGSEVANSANRMRTTVGARIQEDS